MNGVAFAALASGPATNGALPSVAVSWIVTHRRFERLAVGVQRQLVGAVDRFLAGVGDRFAGFVQHLQRLELAVQEVARGFGHVAVEVAVRLLRLRPGLVRAADVLGDPDVAVRVVLDPLVAAAAERAGDVGDDRRGSPGSPRRSPRRRSRSSTGAASPTGPRSSRRSSPAGCRRRLWSPSG